MDPVVSATTESALQIAGRVVRRQVGYFFNYNDKLKEVKHYIKELDNTRKRVQNEVNQAEMNAEEIEDDVQLWLKQVHEKIKKFESFLHDECHVKTRCSIGFFPNNLQLRYRLGRNATKMVEEIKAELFNKKFDKVSYRLQPSVDVALANIGYESFESRTETIDIIMQALEDSTVNMIGVYGVGGVGKTTLVKEVAKKTQEKKLFNVVVMTNITRNPDVKKIQGQIADMLGMRLEEESEIVRADRIRKRLKNEKKNTLIILDDLWDGLDLNRLGIPCSNDDHDGSQQNVKDVSDFGDNDDGSQQNVKDVSDFGYKMMEKDKLSVSHKGCKILLTSRRKEVICHEMDVQERSTFEVGVIDQKEAETLLKKVAGIHSANSVFDEKATEIAKMCGGMPIALVSIGRVLKNKSPIVWKDVCQQIKRQSFTEGWESIEFSVKLSYDHLKNELLKNIFLHCARMGNDALIMDLVKFCIGMGLLRGVQTIREARNKVNILIEELKESSLLVGSYSIDRFNMHDIVRDVALSISSKENNALFMKNGILDEWPRKDELERYTAIFLHYCDINDGLLESIYCPRLEVLHIDSKHDSLKISDDFFKDMIELRVLVLTGVNLSCLPSSIKCLVKLRMLSLERCTLGENLSIVGELKKLQILTLSGSDIETLPLEFGQLDKLQLFDLSNCSKLRVIPSNTISRMNVLEEFYTRHSLIVWEAEENIQSENASLSELRHLNQLGNLDIQIQSVANFPQNLFLDMLDSYKIVIGDFKMLPVGEFKIPDKHEMVKFLALNLEAGIDIHSEKWIKMLFKGVEYLLLGELNDVHDVSYELNVEGFPNLKYLSIVNNFSIQYIIKSMEMAFPKLESMFLNKLDNMASICDSQLTEDSFCNLKIMKIKTCGRLENLFPFSTVRLLTNLETIEVCDCDSLKEIVFVERQTHTINDDKIEFPQLRILTLRSLPTFTCLYTNEKMSAGVQSLEDQVPNIMEDISTEVRQGSMDAYLSLFNEKVLIPKLERLELSSINIQKIWSDQCLESFQNLLTLNVTDCGNLKYLLSLSMAGRLVNLQSLSVNSCKMMEDIFRPEEKENIDVFPKLKTMEIICMERLNTIWQPHIGLDSFPNLDSLIIRKCHKLVTIYPSYMVQRCQSLQSLTITNCKLVENIFDFRNTQQTCERNETNLHEVYLDALPKLVHVWKDDPGEIVRYNNLQSISVDGSPNLKYLLPLSVANDLEKLEYLGVLNCYRMKEIVAWDKDSNENAITFKFPHLKTVLLLCLYELVNFFGGAHTLELSSLKALAIINCWKQERLTTEITNSQGKPIVLATEKVIYNLEQIGMSLKEAEWLQKHVSVHRMHKLQSLYLRGLKNSEILFWFIHRLPNLKELCLEMSQMKRIWAPGSLLSHEKIGVVLQLKELQLLQMFNLEDIGFEHDQLLQRVERLDIDGCMKLTNLASSSVSFSHLTKLKVMNCRLMRNLMTCSTAKSLVQLTTMKVRFCPMIVEIVAEHEEEKVQEIEFRRLKSLELISLKNLTSFCSSEKCGLKFPLLENLVVTECPKMTKFGKLESAPKLQKVQVEAGQKDKWYWEGDLNDTLQKHQVSFEYSVQMKLTDYPKMDGVGRHGKPFPDNFFGCLKKLEFDASYQRVIVIPSHVLPYLRSLEELNVHGSRAVRVIFDINENEAKTNTIAFRLKKLTLIDLPNLKCVWNENPRGMVTFPNLQEVTVRRCWHLRALFPSSIARNLKKLKTLEILICYKLVEIVEKEDALMKHVTNKILFGFPCLSRLQLFELPLLSCFYPGKYHLECPVLESLLVSYCPKLKLFTTSELHDRHKEAVIEGQVSNPMQQFLFSVEKVVPKLKGLALNKENIMLFSDAHLPQDLLCKLKVLELCFEEDKNEKNTLPFDFLHRVPNLENLRVVKCFDLKEIFPSQKLQIPDGILAGLKILELFVLEKLELIGLEHPWVKPYSENLELLTVFKCSRLENIVCCTVSFINLKKLFVDLCKEMKYLFTFSTAKSLVQLVTLVIKDCESLKEIIKKEDEDASHEIIFGQLETLRLYSLPRLRWFYSGNATLQFSCLERSLVASCPNMKTFSKGAINAPLFHGIKTSMEEYDDLTFHDDLNTTINGLFHQQLYLEYTKHIQLVDYPETNEGNWLSIPALLDLFGSIKKLDIDAESRREIVIPSNVLPYLKSLEELNVHGSYHAEVIFDIDESDIKTKGIVFPLKKLELLKVDNCPRLENMVCCTVSFINLKELVVERCDKMEYLFTFSTATSLVQLETLHIKDCSSIKEIIKKEDEDASHDIKFGCLTSLTLDSLPELVRFYSGNATLQFSRLQKAMVVRCPNMNTFSEGSINVPLFEGIQTSVEDSDDLTFNDDFNMTIWMLFHQKLYLEYSKHIQLVDYPETKEGNWLSKPAHLDLFGSIKKLDIDASIRREIVIPSNVLPYLKSLEELNVHNCHHAEVIFDIDESEIKTKGIVFPLKKLTLKFLSKLKCIWNKTPQGIVSFPNLQEIFVSGCRSLATLFPSSLARNLENLETLEIQMCNKLVEIVEKEDTLMEFGTTEILFEFPCLSKLLLDDLQLLSCFYAGKHHLECPILETLHVSCCPKLKLFSSEFHDTHKEASIEGHVQASIQQPLFSVEKVVPKLKALTLNEENIILFSDGHWPEDLLCKLNLLELCFEDKNNKKDALPFDFLHRVPNLEHLKVSKCFGLKEIFHSEKLQVHEGKPTGLKQLSLFNLDELESIGLEHPWVKPYSEKLQMLSLNSCSRLEKLVFCEVSFLNLKQLVVIECERMGYLFPFSTAKSLVQLETLHIEDCESLKEIIKNEDEDASHDIIFECLISLTLDTLPELVRFYSGNATLKFSRLQKAKVVECPNMNTFSEGSINVPLFQGIQTSVEDSDDLTFHDDLNMTIWILFHQKLYLEYSKRIQLVDYPATKEGNWLSKPALLDLFGSIKKLDLDAAFERAIVIPSNVLPYLTSLEELNVHNCYDAEVIFDLKDTRAAMKPASQLSLPLKKLILSQLPNLEHIWNLNPDEILSLQDLQEVHIHSCQSLKSLFPASVANHLVTLEVRHCARLVEIFVEDEAALKGETKQVIFRCLTSLTLWELPELKIFYNGKHSLEWPMLTCLDIYHCDNLELFITKHHSGEVADIKDKLGISIDQQAVFSVEKVFPNLVQLSLKKEDTMAISQEQLQVMPSLEHQEITEEDNMLGQGQFGANAAHLLQNLEVLKLMCYHEDDESSDIFSSGFLEKLPKIENLEVVCSSFNEIFSSQRPSTDCTKILSKLKRLHLNNLQHLNSIGLEHSWVEPLLKTLETLEVFSCPCLKFLVPSTVSFSNLITLNVGKCHGLVYLFTSSTAKCLGQLKHMSIQNCPAIQEIVSKEGDQESNYEEIIFVQLSVLSLEYLPSIVGIYSGTSKLKFPSLDQVTLTECPQMKYSYAPDFHEFKPQI